MKSQHSCNAAAAIYMYSIHVYSCYLWYYTAMFAIMYITVF